MEEFGSNSGFGDTLGVLQHYHKAKWYQSSHYCERQQTKEAVMSKVVQIFIKFGGESHRFQHLNRTVCSHLKISTQTVLGGLIKRVPV